MGSMDSMDFWRLCDELSIVQAALLIAGVDPAEDSTYVETWQPCDKPSGYEATKTAIANGLRRGDIKGEVSYQTDAKFDSIAEMYYDEVSERIDLHESVVSADSLREFLSKRGFKSGFFFSNADHNPEYLNSLSNCYSSKLAAAIHAWEAVSRDDKLRRGKTVKQALMNWLTVHAAQYGLVKDDGRPNENGIEEIAKIANWDTKGGAPKTQEAETIANKQANPFDSKSLNEGEIPF